MVGNDSIDRLREGDKDNDSVIGGWAGNNVTERDKSVERLVEIKDIDVMHLCLLRT